MADPAVAALAAAGDGSGAAASLSSDPDLADLDLADPEGEWPVEEDIISERLGEQAPASSSSSASGEGFRGSVSGSSGGSMDQGPDAGGAMLAAAHKAEAGAKGYGKLYGAFGGGREGLEACAAGEPRLAGPQCASTTECYPIIDTLTFLVTALASYLAPCMLFCSSTCFGLARWLCVHWCWIRPGVSFEVCACSVCSGCAVRGGRDRHASLQLHPPAAGQPRVLDDV